MFKNISRDKGFYRTLFVLSWPGILQNLLSNSLAFLDSLMVGSLGERYLSGISLANTLFFVIALTLFGFQSGSAVLIAQYHGKKDEVAINRVLGIGFGLSFVFSATVALLLLLFPEQIYSLTTNDPELAGIAADFGRIASVSVVFNAMSSIYLSAQRSMENPKLWMYVLGASMTMKTLLNRVLIFGLFGLPGMGVRGAALATLLARVFEFLITFAYAAKFSRFRMKLAQMSHPGKYIFIDYLRFSLPVIINEALWGLGSSLYTMIIGHLPNAVEALAAYSINMNLLRVVESWFIGLCQGGAIIVGKELGGDRRDNALKAGYTLLAVTLCIGAAIGISIAAAGKSLLMPYVFPLFGASTATMNTGGRMLYIMAASVPFRALNCVCIVSLFRSGGDARAGMLIDLICVYFIAMPLALFTGFVLKTPAHIVYMMTCMEEFVKIAFVLWHFRKMTWLRNITR